MSKKPGFTVEDFKVARLLADKLTASCNPSEHWDELNALTQAQCLALDTIALECQDCNHWWPVAQIKDIHGRYVCTECLK